MAQEALFYESFNDALSAVIQSCGGAKPVACKMWPEKTPDAAHRLLLACLNESRVERLTPDQVLFLLRLGREVGSHAAINYISRESGYADPQPIEPDDEKARLQREFIDAQKNMSQLAMRMEKAGLLA
jgi:hypothetical protein